MTDRARDELLDPPVVHQYGRLTADSGRVYVRACMWQCADCGRLTGSIPEHEHEHANYTSTPGEVPVKTIKDRAAYHSVYLTLLTAALLFERRRELRALIRRVRRSRVA